MLMIIMTKIKTTQIRMISIILNHMLDIIIIMTIAYLIAHDVCLIEQKEKKLVEVIPPGIFVYQLCDQCSYTAVKHGR